MTVPGEQEKLPCHSCFPNGKAWQLSEEAEKKGAQSVIFLPVNMELYSDVSENVFKIVEKYTDLSEPASIDEIYFDLSKSGSFKKAESIVKKIQKGSQIWLPFLVQ